MSVQPPAPGTPALPEPGSLRCPRCSATIGPEQDWCLECGAPARTRLAQTPNWQLPTVAIGAIILVAGAMLAFAFVRLTDDGSAPASTPQSVTTSAPLVPPAVVTPPATTTPTTTLPTPATTLPTPTTTPSAPTTTPTTPPPTTPSTPKTPPSTGTMTLATPTTTP